MATPDVRVRLSAEGVSEVVAALKKVKSEADRTAGATKGISRLTSALGGLGQLLPALSVGAAVAGMVALGKRALDTADALDELAQKTGATVEKLSVLFTLPDFVGQEDAISKVLNRLSKNLDKAGPEIAEALGRIGLSIEDVAGKDAFDAFVTIGERLGSYEDGVEKAAVATAVFGKAGADLIPGLNALAEKGFGQLEEEARAAGLVMSGETAAAAAKLKDDIALLEKQAEGAATQFLSGFAPAVSRAMGDSAEATGDMTGAMKTLGRIAGAVIQFLVSGFQVVGKTIGAVVAAAATQIEGLGLALEQSLQGNFSASFGILLDYQKKNSAIGEQLLQDLVEEGDKIAAAFSAIVNGESPSAPGGGGPPKPAIEPGADVAIGKARSALAVAEAENRLALLRARNRLEAGENERAFEAGLRSLEDYFAKRRAILESEARAELEVLRARAAAIQADAPKDEAGKIKAAQELAKIQTEIATRELELQGQLADLAADKAKAEKEAATSRLEAEREIAEIQGDRYRAGLAALELEIQKLDELLRKQGLADAQRQAILDQRRTQGTAALDYEDAAGRGSSVFDELDAEGARLGGLVDAGQMAQVEAEGRLLELQRERLPVLIQIADEMERLALASGNLDLQAEADEFRAAVDSLQISTQRTISLSAQLKQTVWEAGTQALTDFFTTGIKNAESFGDAFKNMAASVADAIANMLAQMLALQIMTMIFRAMGVPVPAGYKTGGLVKMATGGFVSGPGTGTSDSIPALLSNGEFVARAAVVSQPGALDFLEAFNEQGMGALRRYGGPARYADGGLVGEAGAMGTPGRDGSLTIGLEEGLVARHMESPAVVRAIERVVAKNPRAFGRAIGGKS